MLEQSVSPRGPSRGFAPCVSYYRVISGIRALPPRYAARTAMLIDKTNGYLAKTKELAVAAGEQATAALQKQLDYLGTYAQGRADTYLYKDFAPHSFTFRIVGTKLGDTWLDGGLIYSGPGMNGSREQRSDGSGPSFTVSLTPAPANEHHWGVHT